MKYRYKVLGTDVSAAHIVIGAINASWYFEKIIDKQPMEPSPRISFIVVKHLNTPANWRYVIMDFSVDEKKLLEMFGELEKISENELTSLESVVK